MDFQALLLDPIYSIQGVEATLTLESSSEITLTVIDKTAGVDVGDGAEVQTLLPAAVVRVVELTTAGVDRTRLRGALLDFNGGNWEIKSYRPKPTLNGEADGELYLFLEEAEDGTSDASESE